MIEKVNRKFIILGIILLFLFLFSITGIYALNTSSSSDAFESGGVDIELKEFELSSDNLIEKQEQNKLIMPGSEISLIPRIYNLAQDCYVRAKLEIVGVDDDSFKYISSLENWERIGEYYYYEKPLASGDFVDIFNTIKVSEDLGNEYQEKVIKLKIVAEAIQAKNFNPDFSNNSDPWNGIEIKESIDEIYTAGNNNNSITIKYKNNCDKDITIPESFFDNLGNLTPGDKFKEKIEIKNNSGEFGEYYFRLNTDNFTAEEKEILSKITFKITDENGKIIFEGTLASNDVVYLGRLKPNEIKNLYFEMIVPENIDNKFLKIDIGSMWEFSASYEEQSIINIKTGDSIIKFLILFFVSILVLCIVARMKQKSKKI